MPREVLNRAELSALDYCEYVEQQISAHTRTMPLRHPQQVKDRNFHTFLKSLRSQLRRHGVSQSDIRHARTLIAILEAECSYTIPSLAEQEAAA